MKILGLCSHPIESAATRYRLSQYVGPLLEKGIDLTVEPFLSSKQFTELYKPGNHLKKALGMLRPLIDRTVRLISVGKYDLLFVQRESMLFGPPIFERLFRKIGRIPMVLDLDDATYLSYVSPTFGRVGSFLKYFKKTDHLIDMSAAVVCGNPFVAEYVRSRGTQAFEIPTVVDTDLFEPARSTNDVPVLGWIGTHSTFGFLSSLFPVFQSLAKEHRFVLKIVGSGRDRVEVKGVVVDNVEWRLEREIDDFRSIDIGLYPIFPNEEVSEEWIKGKSGFKAIQYLAVGIPFVMSPVGVCSSIGIDGTTHFNAVTHDDWLKHLDTLLSNLQLRKEMGAAGRLHSLSQYTLTTQADKLSNVFREVVANS